MLRRVATRTRIQHAITRGEWILQARIAIVRFRFLVPAQRGQERNYLLRRDIGVSRIGRVAIKGPFVKNPFKRGLEEIRYKAKANLTAPRNKFWHSRSLRNVTFLYLAKQAKPSFNFLFTILNIFTSYSVSHA